MKKLQNLLLLAALLAFGTTAVSCSDDDDPTPTEQVKPDKPDEPDNPTPGPDTDEEALVAGEINYASYIYGYLDDNVAVELIIQSKGITSDGQTISGTGIYADIILGAKLPTETNVITLADGAYNYSDDFTNGVLYDGGITVIKNGQITAKAYVTGGSVSIKGNGNLNYSVTYDLTAATENGEKYTLKESYDMAILPLYEYETSTLTSDIKASFSTCNMGYMGQVMQGVNANFYILQLLNKNSAGQATEICQIYLTTPTNATSGIPAYTYSKWIDMWYQYVTSIPAYSCMAGSLIEEDDNGNELEEPEMAFSWYQSTQHVVRIAGGTFTVAVDGQTYTISGAIEDYPGHKIDISYTGIPTFFDLTQSASGAKSLKTIQKAPTAPVVKLPAKLPVKLEKANTLKFQLRAF